MCHALSKGVAQRVAHRESFEAQVVAGRRQSTVELKGIGAQTLTIERSESGEAGTPGEGDLLLGLALAVSGYRANDEVWVMADEWRRFMEELRALESSREGEATLRGASPRGLELVFKATDLMGHTAVSGFIGWDSPDGFYQRLEFGFEFDAGLLASAVRELAALGDSAAA